jgi:hypothetical protein
VVKGLASTDAGDERNFMLCEKIMHQQGGMCQSVVMMEQPFFSLPQISPFSLIASQSFHHL